MRLKLLGCFLVAVFTLGISACDLALAPSKSAPSGPQPSSLAVTIKGGSGCTTTTPCGMSKGGTALQLQAEATFPNGSTENDTSTVTWTAAPSGIVTLTTSGTGGSAIEMVAGTATGTATITATFAGSSSTLTATAVVQVNPPTLSTISVTPLGPGLLTGEPWQLAATAIFSDGSTQNVTSSASWSSSTAGVVTLSSTPGLVTGTAAGQTIITATYNSVSGSTALNVVSATIFETQSLNGNYAFTLTNIGTNSAKQSVPQYFAGSLDFNGDGGITGVMDSNTTAGIATSVAVTGTYGVWEDGRGFMTLSGSGLPSSSYRFVLTRNLAGTISGQMVQFDGKGSAAGNLIQQANGATLGATEVFRISGVDAAANPLGEVGIFQTDGNGNITSGLYDEDDFGAVTSQATITNGTYTAPASNGRGTLTLNIGTTKVDYVYYVAQPGSLVLLSTDTNSPITLGYAEQQSLPGGYTFSDATLPANTGYAFLLDRSPASGRGTFDTIGRMGFNGAGGVAGGVEDEVGVQNAVISGGTYAFGSNLSASRFSVSATVGTATQGYTIYVVSADSTSATRGFMLETVDNSGAVGTIDVQSSVSLGATNLSGTYGFATADLSQSPGTSAVVWMSAVPNGTSGSVAGIGDVVTASSGGTTINSVILSGSYTPDASGNGRTIILPSSTVGAESFIFYMVNSCEDYMLGVVPSFDGTVFNQSSSVCQ